MIGALTTPLFRTFNYIEAGLWITIGLGFIIAAIRQSGSNRRRCWIVAIDFVVFGISDLIEVQTGAWYRPVWLLILKGACLLVFAWLLIGYLRDRKSRPN